MEEKDRRSEMRARREREEKQREEMKQKHEEEIEEMKKTAACSGAHRDDERVSRRT